MLEFYYKHIEKLPPKELVEIIRTQNNTIDHLYELIERLDKEKFELNEKVRNQKEMIEILAKNEEEDDEK